MLVFWKFWEGIAGTSNCVTFVALPNFNEKTQALVATGVTMDHIG